MTAREAILQRLQDTDPSPVSWYQFQRRFALLNLHVEIPNIRMILQQLHEEGLVVFDNDSFALKPSNTEE